MRPAFRLHSALVAAMLMALVLIAAPRNASAQSCQITVTNTTTCAITVCMNNTCAVCLPGVTTTITPPACGVAGNTITADICGIQRQLTPGQCCNNVGVGVGGCCGNICLTQTGPGTYTMTITPGGPICRCIC
ncbi:MAG: hypothetical protein JST22_09960 [Bacteroidetes bacterium]|nr:hypothetical protein [Bacteroidota bacterium]